MCWRYGTVTETQLQNAVVKGYITEEEFETIMAM
ncbi:XkdX family protein [Hazenella sp. IB182357]|uniref:XkdX family protein n=1 Tax=Polycladospora coralii TaxID=2771432 RepID=A0A926N6N3_9BACL|nr:XkdX family protein [Polycladospora coralii]MBD1372491.1 XkdX family protein [Polycladospora coralii]